MMQASLVALITAFVIDILLGDPPNRFHPTVAMGSTIRWVSSHWNKGNSFRRFITGAALILFGGSLFSLPWLVLWLLPDSIPVWLMGILIGIFLKPVFAFRGLLKAGREVQKALVENDISEGRRLVAWHLVSRDTSQLSEEQVASAVIESLAENLTDSFFAPLMFFAVGGLPAAWFYRFTNTADAMIGYRTAELEYFGKFAARLDDVLNWLPAQVAGLILVISAGLAQLDIKSAWRIMFQQHQRTSSPNAGWTMAAAAGALGVTLEKQAHYRLEGGAELPQVRDIERAIRLVTVSLVVSLFVCGGLAYAIAALF